MYLNLKETYSQILLFTLNKGFINMTDVIYRCNSNDKYAQRRLNELRKQRLLKKHSITIQGSKRIRLAYTITFKGIDYLVQYKLIEFGSNLEKQLTEEKEDE